jgi:DivIVA domain-containing protein
MTIAWQEDPKRLTPDEVQAVTFPLSRIGRRGFDEESVRAFLAEVERELVTLLNEKVSLWNEVERLRRRIIAGMKQGDAAAASGVLFGREDAHVHAVRILSNAQLTADRYVADAQAYSHRLTEEARTRRDEILTEAQEHADMVLDEASNRAREAAIATLDAPAEGEHLQADRSALKAELAYLRTFGEVYRAHLRAYTEGMLRSIADWEDKEAHTLAEVAATANGQPQNGHHEPGRFDFGPR